jgi:hypothetical protein
MLCKNQTRLCGLLVALASVKSGYAFALTPCQGMTVTRAAPQETRRVPANNIGCATAGHIVMPSAHIYNCRAAERADGELGPDTILVRTTNARLQILRQEMASQSLLTMTAYDVNLGGNASAEHVLAIWQTQQNGFGTNFWTLLVFDPSWKLVTSFKDVEDFGRHNLVQNGQSCALAITKYDRIDIGAQISPMFYQARFVAVAGDAVVPATGLAPVRRRYTNQFERQRWATFDRQPGMTNMGLAKEGDLVAWINSGQR